MISVLLVVCVSVAAVSLRAVGSLRRRAALRLQALVSAPARLAAALLDLGNHLMLSAEERRAMRLRRWLSSTRARRLGVAAAAVRAGAKRLDDVTLEIPIGTRTLEGNPGRTLALSCVVYEPSASGAATDPLDEAATPFWRVLNKASPGYRESSVTVEVPELERALLSYHARPLRPEGEAIGARFFDEDIHEEPAMQATRRRKKNPVNLV